MAVTRNSDFSFDPKRILVLPGWTDPGWGRNGFWTISGTLVDLSLGAGRRSSWPWTLPVRQRNIHAGPPGNPHLSNGDKGPAGAASGATKARVLAAAKRLDWVPGSRARALAARRANAVGRALSRDPAILASDSFPALTSGLGAALTEHESANVPCLRGSTDVRAPEVDHSELEEEFS